MINKKDKNILDRFETKNQGSKTMRYRVFLKSGAEFDMLCMSGETIDHAKESCKLKFLSEFSHVESRS